MPAFSAPHNYPTLNPAFFVLLSKGATDFLSKVILFKIRKYNL